MKSVRDRFRPLRKSRVGNEQRPSHRIREWILAGIAIATIVLSTLAYLDNRRARDAEFTTQVFTEERRLGEPVVNLSKDPDPKTLRQTEENVKSLAEKNPGSAAVLVVGGEIALRLGNPELADLRADSALKKDPQNPKALIIKGIVATKLRKPREAKIFLKRASAAAEARQMPIDSSVAKLDLANQCVLEGTAEEAKRLLEEPLRNPITRPLALNTLGILNMRMGNLSEASQNFAEAVKLDPDYTNSARNLACSLELQGKIEGPKSRPPNQSDPKVKTVMCSPNNVIPDAGMKGAYWTINEDK